MIKLVFVIRRRKDMAPEEFHRYWLEELGALGYVQTHTLDSDLNHSLTASRGTLEAYDGLAEVSWDSVDALVAAFGSEEGQRANKALTEDEARFIDLERSSIFLTEE